VEIGNGIWSFDRQKCVGSGSLFARVVSHKKLLPFDISGVPEYRPQVFPFLYGRKSLQVVWLTGLPIQR